MRISLAAIVALLLLLASAARADVAPAAPTGNALASLSYKAGEVWPVRNFEGADFLEPLFPRTAWARGDGGRIVLDTALPLALFVSAFAFRGTDHGTLREIQRWGWVGVDDGQDNRPFLYGMIGMSILAIAIPAPAEDAGGTSWGLRLDRVTVLAASYALAAGGITPLWKDISLRARPNGNGRASRPSGHATAAGIAAAFTSDVLRDIIRPETVEPLGLRLIAEAATALPYLGAAYMSLERVHDNKHFLSDTLLGDAIGILVTHMLYAWSFTRIETGRGWAPQVTMVPMPEGGAMIAFAWRF